MWQQGPVWGGLERSPPPKTHYIKMGLKQVLPILALAATCHGAALPEAEHFDMDTVMDLVQEFIANPDPYMEAFGVRAKRHVEDLNRSGFKQFPIPFIGAEVGIKYKDPSNRDKGGEAYVEILDLASLVPRARSRKVQLHAKFDGGASNSDGLFTMEVDYHFQHKDGSGTEEGSMKVVREKRGGMWHTDIKTEAHPFSGPRPIIPARINSMEFEVESDRQTKLKGKYVNANMGRDITWDIVRQPGKNIKAVITRGGVTSTVEGSLDGGGDSAPGDDGLDVLARLADDVPGDVTAHVGVHVLALQFCLPVGFNLELHAVDPGRDNGTGSGEGVSLSLDVGVPHASPLLPHNLHGTLLSAGAILVLEVVIDLHGEKAVGV